MSTLTMNFRVRSDLLRTYMAEHEIGMSILSHASSMFYFTNFSTVVMTGSRLALVLIEKEKTAILVPDVEAANAVGFSLEKGHVDEVIKYYEKCVEAPLYTSPYDILRDQLKGVKEKRIGIEFDACTYEVAQFIRSLGFELFDITPQVRLQRAVKAPDEIEHIRLAASLSAYALDASLKALRPGITEEELDGTGTRAVAEQVKKLGLNVSLKCLGNVLSGPVRTTMPHVRSSSRKIEAGDSLVISRQIGVNGWEAELERTIFLGEPDQVKKDYYLTVQRAQMAVIGTTRPGVACNEVDRAAFTVLKEAGLEQYVIHRSGHGLGVTTHDYPVLSFVETMPIRQGMCFSAEPGIYVPGVGGFRNSDTIFITESGNEKLTDFPSSLEAMTIPV